MDRVLRWKPMEGFGAEHLHIKSTSEGLLAQGVVIGLREDVGYGLFYRIVLDQGWRVREVELSTTGAAEKLVLRADGKGRWQSAEGLPLPALDGCIDIDIAATPFTNTLPIRRLRLSEGVDQVIRVVYIPVPTLEPIAVDQRYTCLQSGRLYRYEGLSSGFDGELPIDDDGFVIDYPNTFRRLLT
jgi:uncharacterized protein